jgi:hypothetical protein
VANITDGIVVLRLLKLLSTPIEKSDAYKYGIIDKNGKKIKKPDTAKERDSYTILNRLVFKLQYALGKSPDRNSKRLLSLAAAIAILREHNAETLESYDDKDIDALLDMYEIDDLVHGQAKLLEHNTLTFRNFSEEMGVAGGAIAGIGIDHPTKANQAEPGRDPVMMPMVRRKKKKKNGNS